MDASLVLKQDQAKALQIVFNTHKKHNQQMHSSSYK
jgi:hypothetical protein